MSLLAFWRLSSSICSSSKLRMSQISSVERSYNSPVSAKPNRFTIQTFGYPQHQIRPMEIVTSSISHSWWATYLTSTLTKPASSPLFRLVLWATVEGCRDDTMQDPGIASHTTIMPPLKRSFASYSGAALIPRISATPFGLPIAIP